MRPPDLLPCKYATDLGIFLSDYFDRPIREASTGMPKGLKIIFVYFIFR